MSVSVIIPCHKDTRIFRCIESLGTPSCSYEIIVILTESSKVLVPKLSLIPNVVIAWAPVGNLARSLNIGFEASKNECILILNADVTCSPGYINTMYAALETRVLAKATIRHMYRTHFERVVGQLRDFVHSMEVFYGPTVAFRRDLLSNIGGHLFNDRVWWSEDGELSHRISNAGLRIERITDAEVVHEPEGIWHDLKGAFRIGRGKFAQILYAGRSRSDESLWLAALRIANGKTLGNYMETWKKTNLTTTLYAVLWDIVFYAGYWKERITHREKTLGNNLESKGARL